MIKRIIFRTVAIALIVAGFKFAWQMRRPSDGLTNEQVYTQKMSELSDRYNAIEKEVSDANMKAASQPKKTPGSANEVFGTLAKAYKEKDQYLADLKALEVPKKYEEAHTTFLAMQKQEHETEGKLIEGYRAFNLGKKEVASTIESLIDKSDKASKEYEIKLNEIAKKSGIESVKKLFQK